MNNNNNKRNESIISVLRNKVLICTIGRHIHSINIQITTTSLHYGVSYRFNNIPSLKWVVCNPTGSLLHQLCKRSPITNELPLSTLQVEWIPLDSVIAVCSPHRYNKSITFSIETFDVIYNYYESAFKNEHCALDCAAESGNIQLVKYLISKNVPFTTNAIDRAANNGNLDIIKLLIDYNPINHPKIFDDNVKFTNHSYDRAATNGHLDVLLYFDQLRESYQKKKSKYRVDFTETAIDGASTNNHFNIVDHILNKYGKDKKMKGYLFTSEALKWCLGHNNIEMLNRLCNSNHPDKNEMFKNDRWIVEGLSQASSKGHLDAMKWVLNRKPLEFIPQSLLVDAVQNQYLEVVQFYIDLFKDKRVIQSFRLENGIYKAIKLSHFEIFKVLFGFAQKSETQIDRLLESACRNGNIQVLEWLIATQGITADRLRGFLSVACLNGQLNVIKYLTEEKRIDVPKSEHLENCVISKSVECVEYVYSQGVRPTPRAVVLACRKGLPTIVKLFLSDAMATNNLAIYGYGEKGKEYYEEALLPLSISCIKEVVDHLPLPPVLSTAEIQRAIEKGDLEFVKYVFRENSPLKLIGSLGLIVDLIELGLASAISFRYHHMVDFLLGLKPPEGEVDEEFKRIAANFIPPNGFKVSPVSYQVAVRECDMQMIEIIHRHRPQLACTSPHDLLIFGYIGIFDKVIKWNEEIGSIIPSEVTSRQREIGSWYLKLIERGDIDLINYITTVRKIVIPPIPSRISVTPITVTIQSITYILTSPLFQFYSTRPILTNFLRDSSIAKDFYSGCKLLFDRSPLPLFIGNSHHGEVSYMMSYVCQNNNLAILRLYYKAEEKRAKLFKAKIYANRRINKSIIVFCKGKSSSSLLSPFR